MSIKLTNQLHYDWDLGISLKMTQMIHFWVDPSNNIEKIVAHPNDFPKHHGHLLE